MVEDVQFLRAQFMKKEKLIKDVVRMDSRPAYQFVSAARKELEKDKNVMAAKLYFLFKFAKPFSPGGAGQATEDTKIMHGHLQKIVDQQMKYVDVWMAQAEQKAKPKAGPDVPTAAMIKDIIQQYIQTKELLKQKIRSYILTRRTGSIQKRLDDAVRDMKPKGGVEAFAGGLPVEEFLKRQEMAIVVEMVMDDMAEKTSALDKVVNRIVEWRAKSAAVPSNTIESRLADQEITALVLQLMEEINKLKDREKLIGGTESGIVNTADGRAELARLKSNINEQRVHIRVLEEPLTKSLDPATKTAEFQGNNEMALNACDKIETLVKDERNMYLNFRKWEVPPGQFLEEMSLSTQIISDKQ